MALNISLPSSAITELESYRWYSASGASLKDVQTKVMFDGSTWTDVSDFVMMIAISGGAVNLTGEPGANNASVEINNADKRFSDLWAAGPYYGNLAPGKRVHIDLSVLSSTVTIFDGRVDEAGFVESRSGHEGSARIGVLDGAGWLEKKKFDKDYYYAGKKLVGTGVSDSLLHILLMTHGGLSTGNVITNGEVSVIVPYTVFKEGESVQYRIRELARGCQPRYCGFRYDGNFIMESRLVGGWSVPSSEYVLEASGFEVDVEKSLSPLLGNRVKVRGDKVDFVDQDIVLWELRSIKPKGKNRVFPGWCWETVATGNFFLSDPGATPPEEFWAQYEVAEGEIIHVQSTAMSQTIYEGSAYNLNTTGTSLEAEEKRGKLVLQNSQPQSINVMNLQITGKAAIRRSLRAKSEADIAHLKLDHGISDDDLSWGLVACDSNASSIAAYGQTDLVISSEYIVDNSQMIAILDWNLKYGKDPKHHFAMGNLPFLAFVQPGAMLDLHLGDLGYSALVEVAEFSHQITPDGSKTVLTLAETPDTWTVSCAASVREIIAAPSGGTGEGEVGAAGLGGNFVYTLGGVGCELPVDALCDGIADDVEINKAAVIVRDNGGGKIALVRGLFVIASYISLMNNTILEICKDASISAVSILIGIRAIGTAASHLTNVGIIGQGSIALDRTKPWGGVTNNWFIDIRYADGVILNDFIIEDVYSEGVYVANCTKVEAERVKILGIGGHSTANSIGFQFDSCDGFANELYVDGENYENPARVYGIASSKGMRVTGAIVTNIKSSGGGYPGITGILAYGKIAQNRIANLRTISPVSNVIGIQMQENAVADNNIIDTIISKSLMNTVGIYGNGEGIIRNNIITNVFDRGISVIGAWNKILNNVCKDNGQLIENWDCDGLIPYLKADGYSLLNATVSIASTISAYDGTSYAIFKKTNWASAASAAYYWLVDNNTITDMHTLSIIQGSYKLAARMRCPTGGVDPTEAQLIVSQYSGGAWVDTTMSCPSTLSTWALVEATMTMLSTCVATRLGFKAAATAEINETFHIDNVQFIPMGVTNEHRQNFYDAGTDTATGGNSWQ
jgi:hypothetical protein